MHYCYGWELCVSVFMAPSDSQHPEIGAEVEEEKEEDEEGEEEVDETKQNKHRGHSRAAAAGLGQPSHGRGGGGGARAIEEDGSGVKVNWGRQTEKDWESERGRDGRGLPKKKVTNLSSSLSLPHSLTLSRVLTRWWPASISHSFDLWPPWLFQLVQQQNEQKVKFHSSQVMHVTLILSLVGLPAPCFQNEKQPGAGSTMKGTQRSGLLRCSFQQQSPPPLHQIHKGFLRYDMQAPRHAASDEADYQVVWPRDRSSDPKWNIWCDTSFLLVSNNIRIVFLLNSRHEAVARLYTHPHSAAHSKHTGLSHPPRRRGITC